MSDDHFCTKHNCKKVWMVQNSFCPKCEEEQHGDAGKTTPVIDIWDQLNDELEEEKTQPMSGVASDLIDAARYFHAGQRMGKTTQMNWERKHGQFVKASWHEISNPAGELTIFTTSNTFVIKVIDWRNLGLPQSANPYRWYPKYAELVP